MNIQLTLENVAQQGLLKSSSDEMMLLACAFWHEDFLPDLLRIEALPVNDQKIIGYLIKFFSAFNCIGENRAAELADLSEKIRVRVKPLPSDNVDDFAAQWGLAENINPFLPDILHMQTRHYIHTPWKRLSCYKDLFS